MKRVLLPIDGSECSLRAVQYLFDQRADRSSPVNPEIHLVNVQFPFSGHVGQFINREQIAGFQRDEGAKALQSARALLWMFFSNIGDLENARTQIFMMFVLIELDPRA